MKKDETQLLRDAPCRPVVEHPGPAAVEDLLQSIDPAADDETERFVASIYADRREAAGDHSGQ